MLLLLLLLQKEEESEARQKRGEGHKGAGREENTAGRKVRPQTHSHGGEVPFKGTQVGKVTLISHKSFPFLKATNV